MVEVFKTNIEEHLQAENVISLLAVSFPECKINFDLEDCDKILRLEGTAFSSEEIIGLLKAKGFNCEPLN